MKYEAIVVGVSAGGLNAMKILFFSLPADFRIPIIVVQHVSARSDGQWINLLNAMYPLYIKEADEKEKIAPHTVYIAPPNYHLLIAKNKSFSLTIDERVNFARPSIDVLFESAASVYKNKLIGIILTGSNSDGTKGITRIQEYGGLVIIQDPETAESSYMPASALDAVKPDHVLPLQDIPALLINLEKQKE